VPHAAADSAPVPWKLKLIVILSLCEAPTVALLIHAVPVSVSDALTLKASVTLVEALPLIRLSTMDFCDASP